MDFTFTKKGVICVPREWDGKQLPTPIFEILPCTTRERRIYFTRRKVSKCHQIDCSSENLTYVQTAVSSAHVIAFDYRET